MAGATTLHWRAGNVARVAFIVADAPPHDKNLRVTLDAALDLRRQGVRVYGLAASGVATTAEYMMRLIALLTGARYTWLTDDSGIGDPHAEPAVVCYQVTRLDQLLVRILTSEMLGKRVEPRQEDIIREVGKQEAGICIVHVMPQEDEEEEEEATDESAKDGELGSLGAEGDFYGPASDVVGRFSGSNDSNFTFLFMSALIVGEILLILWC